LDEGRHAEWVDGRVIELDPSTAGHQQVVGVLLVLLWIIAERQEHRPRVFTRFLMRLTSPSSCREPDLAFVKAEHTGRITTYHINGPADLVVEVVSADSVTRDYHEKLAEYEAGGIPEYWIIDPMRREARFYQLSDDGHYRLVPIRPDGSYASEVVDGLRLRVDWLWQRPMPTIDEALADLPA